MGIREMGRHWSTEEEREISTMREKQRLEKEISKMRPTCKSHTDDKRGKRPLLSNERELQVIQEASQLTLQLLQKERKQLWVE